MEVKKRVSKKGKAKGKGSSRGNARPKAIQVAPARGRKRKRVPPQSKIYRVEVECSIPVWVAFTIAMPLDATCDEVESVAEIICDRLVVDEFLQLGSPADVYIRGADREIHGYKEDGCDYRVSRAGNETWRVNPKSRLASHKFDFPIAVTE